MRPKLLLAVAGLFLMRCASYFPEAPAAPSSLPIPMGQASQKGGPRADAQEAAPAQQQKPPAAPATEPPPPDSVAPPEQPSAEAQSATESSATAAPQVAPADSEAPSTPAPLAVDDAAKAAVQRRDAFPNLNIYLPEGEFDIRVRKLIRNVLFEGQVNYNFVNGDISTFLRYKYYARNFTYKIGVFDQIEFSNVESISREFQRTRGGFVLTEVPKTYNSRYYFLAQVDGLSFGDTDNPDNNKNNVYAKAAWQYGSPFDERMNSIVGESRGRITPVLTAYRDIGPQKLGLALAVTQSFKSVGDYHYTKLEGEALKRIDVSKSTFVFSRFHVGSIVGDSRIGGREDLPETAQHTVPYYEYFRLGGRDALKGVDDHVRGSEEFHLANEYFFPIFRVRDYATWGLNWNSLYGIGYAGAGAIGFDSKVFTETRGYAVDGGLGVEAALSYRSYDLFLVLMYARTFAAPDLLAGDEIRFSLRTVR